jgi:hypothetical protein
MLPGYNYLHSSFLPVCQQLENGLIAIPHLLVMATFLISLSGQQTGHK